VGHVELTTHFIAALGLLVYTLWFALKLLVPSQQLVHNAALKKFSIGLVILLFVQLTYGGFMAGLKAATVAPTWPTINGEWFPSSLYKIAGGANYVNNPFMVQFIHRGIAYLFTVCVIVWFFKTRSARLSPLFQQTKVIPLLLVSLQVTLGVLTVLYSTSATAFVWFGVLHQFVAMLLLMSLVWVLYLVKKP
jgi:heme a synthase